MDSFGKVTKSRFLLKLVEPNYTLKQNQYFGQTQHEFFKSRKGEKTTPDPG
jgi:hypothetical protein